MNTSIYKNLAHPNIWFSGFMQSYILECKVTYYEHANWRNQTYGCDRKNEIYTASQKKMKSQYPPVKNLLSYFHFFCSWRPCTKQFQGFGQFWAGFGQVLGQESKHFFEVRVLECFCIFRYSFSRWLQICISRPEIIIQFRQNFVKITFWLFLTSFLHWLQICISRPEIILQFRQNFVKMTFWLFLTSFLCWLRWYISLTEIILQFRQNFVKITKF